MTLAVLLERSRGLGDSYYRKSCVHDAVRQSQRYDTGYINQFRDTLENLIPLQLDGSSEKNVMDVLVTGCGLKDEVARQYNGGVQWARRPTCDMRRYSHAMKGCLMRGTQK